MNKPACVYEAGERLSHIRALICKSLRAGVEIQELSALLQAEEMAASRLAQLMR